MIALITQGIGFGFAAGTSPGPFQSYIINTTLNYGWRYGLLVIFSPLIVDAPIILVMTFLLQQLPAVVLQMIQIAGGLFVLYLAWSTFKALHAGQGIGGEAAETAPRRRLFSQALTMNALSPGPYIFWGSITGPILVEALAQSWLHAGVFLLGFYTTFMTTLAALVLIFDRLRRLNPRITLGLLYLTIFILALLGVQLIFDGITG